MARWLTKALALAFALAGSCASVFAAPAMAAPENLERPGAERPRVAFFVIEDYQIDNWAQSLIAVATDSAADLNIDLAIVPYSRNRLERRDSLMNYVAEFGAPDYAILINHFGQVAEELTYLESIGVKSFLFNAGLSDDERQKISGPRIKLKNWLGEITPDDYRAGYDLARALIAKARTETTARPIKVIGMTGAYANPVAKARVKGLEQAVAEMDDAVLLQTVSTRWSADVAAQKYANLLNRYGDVDVVWAANDNIGLGVAAAAAAVGKSPVIGGMDWTREAQAAIREGVMHASMGGHVTDVAYVMAMIRLHSEGVDFARLLGGALQKTALGILTEDNIDERDALFTRVMDGSFDFGELKREIASGNRETELSIERLFDERNR